MPMVLKPRNPKSSFSQGHATSETLCRILLCVFLISGGGLQSLPFLGVQLHDSNLCLCSYMVISLCVSVSKFSSYKESKLNIKSTSITSS